jgi:3-oxoacyl-[acyl-carrier-protein] synthase-3
MAFLSIPNVRIKGLSVCVPKIIEENISLPLFAEGEALRVIESTGIERRRIVSQGTTTSDLCAKAAERLLIDLKWNNSDVDCLVFVSSSRDFITPPTSCILQHTLNLRQDCYTIDIPCGCPGWLYGLSVISSLLNTGSMKKGLLLVGDTSTTLNSSKDKSTRPLFGDAGTATAIEFVAGENPLNFQFGTDGGSYDAIISKDGGSRNPFTSKSLIEIEYAPGIIRRPMDCEIKGMDVFAFSISKAPGSIKDLMSNFAIIPENVDFLFLHQANKYILDKIRKKLNFPNSKVPYCLKDYGNTSCASIPLTMVSQCSEILKNSRKENIACAFGVGLSWGSVHFITENLSCCDLIEY